MSSTASLVATGSSESAERSPPRRLSYPYGEAGELLGLSPKTIFNLVKAGELKSMKIGASVRIPHAELERFVADRAVVASA